MASHRRPPQHRRTKSRTAQRGAATLATAAATVTGVIAFAAPSHADPAPTVAQVQEQVNQLNHEVSKQTDLFNGVQEKIEKLQKDSNATQDRVAQEQAAMSQLRDQLGTMASEQYRTGGIPPELQLALSGNPGDYLSRAQMIDQLDSQQATKLQQIAAQARMLQQDRAEASAQLAELDGLRQDLNAKKGEIQEKLNKAQTLLNTLTAAERQKVLDAADQADSRTTDRSSRDNSRTDLPNVPASPRAAEAIAFARAQIGKPYGWGKEGPASFDCSGLTKAAWAAADVSLPRTTWDQINAGTRVSKADLQPGDLVFFYSDISHVGLYIGDGLMIHAPHSGTTIKIAPISQMPFYGAVRPG
ncbi:C40 family peptidase [Yinghuangia seranimata]|uniref:C40 family peptidase n=1 Tax=Yinghuangia seranimata TaxID=408067 RepID=UPI00248D12E6|nr:C40 family peptidase [Yinghuangia seranimata]MDI2126801.1 NlpC/P60 family protein [Yinghuangia seranimata]